MSVHQKCYELSKIPSGDWICQLCSAFGPAGRYLPCPLCTRRGGVMKSIDIDITKKIFEGLNPKYADFQKKNQEAGRRLLENGIKMEEGGGIEEGGRREINREEGGGKVEGGREEGGRREEEGRREEGGKEEEDDGEDDYERKLYYNFQKLKDISGNFFLIFKRKEN